VHTLRRRINSIFYNMFRQLPKITREAHTTTDGSDEEGGQCSAITINIFV